MTKIIIVVLHILFFLSWGFAYHKMEDDLAFLFSVVVIAFSAFAQVPIPNLKIKERYVIFISIATIIFFSFLIVA